MNIKVTSVYFQYLHRFDIQFTKLDANVLMEFLNKVKRWGKTDESRFIILRAAALLTF